MSANDHLGAVEQDSDTGLSLRFVRSFDPAGERTISAPPIGPERDAFLDKFHEDTLVIMDIIRDEYAKKPKT